MWLVLSKVEHHLAVLEHVSAIVANRAGNVLGVASGGLLDISSIVLHVIRKRVHRMVRVGFGETVDKLHLVEAIRVVLARFGPDLIDDFLNTLRTARVG